MNDVAASSPQTHEYVHSCRRHFLACERTYRLAGDGLEWREGKHARLIPYGDIAELHEYKSKVWGALAAKLPRRFDYLLRCRDGEKLAINAVHHAGFRRLEDRSSSLSALIEELRKRAAAANPELKSFTALSSAYRLSIAADRAGYRFALLLWKLVRRIDFDHAANFCAFAMRRIGPLLRGHRTARANLIAAYPEKSAAEIEQILSGMWENLGRLGVEYVNLDRLVDPLNPNAGRIVVAPGTLEILERLRDDGKPAVLFTAHLASYEVGAIWVKCNGLDLAIFYNPSNFGPLSEELQAMQKSAMGRLVPSGPDAVWKLREALKSGLHLALFADQHFANGVEVNFFGRRCKANPMLARFAQLFECPVHAFRTVRLPGNRIQVEFTEQLPLSRGADGRIDIAAAMGMATSRLEDWVRQYPEQWLWLQRRWR
jgi:KDO2-lipid IV(A) lauroyltransferase